MASRVCDLVSGDVVEQGGMRAVFIVRTRHPLYASLWLVVWRLHDGTWSHDALAWEQEVGDVRHLTPADRQSMLRTALGGDWKDGVLDGC